MVEYIEREAVLRDLREAGSDGGMGDLLNGVLELYIKSVPSADVAPVVHGRWEEHAEYAKCSVCADECWADSAMSYNYCPNCGAKMDLEED